ncbi:MAG TPA: hypothetical protein GXZ96_05360 [Firmicutes bacterium]|jgi:hypothetical protein|nr:hypothetical protein [Bacillota bacterium]
MAYPRNWRNEIRNLVNEEVRLAIRHGLSEMKGTRSEGERTASAVGPHQQDSRGLEAMPHMGVQGFGPMFQGMPQMPLGQAYPPPNWGVPQQPNQGIGTAGGVLGVNQLHALATAGQGGGTGLVAQQGVQLALQQELEMNLLKLQQVISESQQIAKKLELILGEVSQGTMQDAGQGQGGGQGGKKGK